MRTAPEGTARLWLEFSRPQKDQSTVLRVKQQEVPWRVLRGFPTPSGETLAHLNNISGGILDTDSLHLRIDVKPSAWAQLTSTGATRIYRSRSPEQYGRSVIDVEVGEEGFLEFLPDALIPYRGSRFQQTARIQLMPGAALIWWDVVSPGREASGEVFCYHRLASCFEIRGAGRAMIEERWELAPGPRPLDSVARLGPFRHFASLYVCRAAAPESYWQTLGAELSRLADEQSRPNELFWGASSLARDGVVLRGLARSGRLLMRSLTGLWGAAKLSLCGRVATLPRKIY